MSTTAMNQNAIESFKTSLQGDILLLLRKNYDRLVEIKTKWDPENLFRMNKNIPPKVN